MRFFWRADVTRMARFSTRHRVWFYGFTVGPFGWGLIYREAAR